MLSTWRRSGYIASCQALKILRAMLLESGSSSKNGAHCGPISSEAGQKRGEVGGGVPTKACPLMTNAFTINVQMSANMAAEHGGRSTQLSQNLHSTSSREPLNKLKFPDLLIKAGLRTDRLSAGPVNSSRDHQQSSSLSHSVRVLNSPFHRPA